MVSNRPSASARQAIRARPSAGQLTVFDEVDIRLPDLRFMQQSVQMGMVGACLVVRQAFVNPFLDEQELDLVLLLGPATEERAVNDEDNNEKKDG